MDFADGQLHKILGDDYEGEAGSFFDTVKNLDLEDVAKIA